MEWIGFEELYEITGKFVDSNLPMYYSMDKAYSTTGHWCYWYEIGVYRVVFVNDYNNFGCSVGFIDAQTSHYKFYLDNRIYSPGENCDEHIDFVLSRSDPNVSFQYQDCIFRDLLNFFKDIIDEYRNSHPDYAPVSFEDLVNIEMIERRQRDIRKKADRPLWRRIFR